MGCLSANGHLQDVFDEAHVTVRIFVMLECLDAASEALALQKSTLGVLVLPAQLGL